MPNHADLPVAHGAPIPYPSRSVGQGTLFDFGGEIVPHVVRFRVESYWIMASGSRHVSVFTGADSNDTAQGVLSIRSTDPGLSPSGDFKTPSRLGAIRIADVVDHRIVVEPKAGGPRLAFDLATHQFVPDQS
jgi:hypothetical protein